MPDDGPVREVGIDFGKFPAGDDYRIAVISGPQDGIQQRFGPDGLYCKSMTGACACAARPGAALDANVVVGADGVHSLTRDWVTRGDEPVYSGTSGFAGWSRPGSCATCSTRSAAVLGRARRAPAALPDLWRQADQLPGGNRQAGPLGGAGLDGARRAWRTPRGVRRVAPRGHRADRRRPNRRAGACSPAGRSRNGAGARSCCWATPRTRCCHTTGKAPIRQSRTPSCWPRSWAPRRCACGAAQLRPTPRRCGPGKSS